jgi:hypothetical protein
MPDIYLFFTIFIVILLSCLLMPQIVNAYDKSKEHFDSKYGYSHAINPQILNPDVNLLGRTIPVPKSPLTPPNQAPITALTRAQIAAGLELPKNLIVATCPPQSQGGGTGCPPVVGTAGDDLIIAAAVQDASIYGIAGNDVIQCGPGNCKVYAGPGDNVVMASSSTTAQLYGGFGNNMFIGGTGNTLMVGGKGNDQFYAGSGHDIMIGGGGRNYFDCGTSGNGVILDFNAKNGDTKAGNCKYVVTVKTGVPALP